MNIEEARRDLEELKLYLPYFETEETKRLDDFIDEVEHLLKHNPIKQVPALFKEKK